MREQGISATGEPLRPAIRAQLLDEGLEILSRLWTGEPVTFHGHHFQAEHLQLAPLPVQQWRIPVWAVGHWELAGVNGGSCAGKAASYTRVRPTRIGRT
jgi:alkanesulfonate monooxygenase SsuD/methylene tetrahydromethanopterin reductase-like flavin-dependent oxidoreductase (luciferase family)